MVVVEGDTLAPLTQRALDRHSRTHGGDSGQAEEDRSSVASQSIIDQPIDDHVISLSFPFTFDGVAHRVSFDYDLREAPADVAAEFAADCGYPVEEMQPFAEFLASVRQKHRRGTLQQQQPPTAPAAPQQQTRPQQQQQQYENGKSFGPPTAAALAMGGVTSSTTYCPHEEGSSFDDGSSVRKVDDGEDLFDGDDVDDDDAAATAQCEREYEIMRTRYETIHEDRMTKLQQAKENSVSSHAEAAAKFEEQLLDLQNKERDITISKDAMRSNQERMMKKHDKDMQDFERT